jgi:glycosyltransferase involved in cell wall biosynthesis
MSDLICHLIDANLDTAYFRSIIRYHDQSKFRVMIGSLASEGPLQRAMMELGAQTFALSTSKRWQYGEAIRHLVRLVRQEKISVLHAHCFDPTFVGLVVARIANIPFVYTRHHSDHNVRLGKRWHTRMDAWCGRHANRAIAVSEATKRVMVEIEGIPEDKIVVVYNGVQPPAKPSAMSVACLRQELGTAGEPVCLVIARLHEEKGHRVLFDALGEILPRLGPLTVLLAGEGPHLDQLQSEVRSRGLESCVRFLGRRADIPALISLSSVVVLPSLAESFGFAVLEAMSLCRPVIASATGGIPEVVIDGETGVLVPPGDAQALGEALYGVVKNREWASTLGKEGCRRASLFSAERMIRGYENVYACLATGGSCRAH